jgi:ribonucleoside-diphosphate reductase alpha chain
MKKEMNQIKVVKRNGSKEPVNFEKIQSRIEKQSYKLNEQFVQPFEIARKVLSGIYDGVTTRQLDELSVETAATLTTIHPDYSKLAARLAVTTLHKDTVKSFSATMQKLHEYVDPKNGLPAPLVSKEFIDVVRENAARLDGAIVHNRDFNYDYFGYKTLEKSYLLRMHGKVVERPQHLIMRVAVGIHGTDIDSALKTYDLISDGWFTHATPTLFNAGTKRPQMSSCFLLKMHEDSIDGIYETLAECARISKNAGGIGIAASNVRASGSYIKGTNGTSNGLVPMLKVFNETARYVDQGGGRRKGSFAIYLEPWHGDIFDFLDLKKNHGKEENRARDLFLGIWMPDLFMQRVEQDLDWSLMCPSECPGLDDVYAEAFVELYERYEAEGKYMRKVKARDVWHKILESQMETGVPYILYKDSANVKSNQKNIATLKTSNLCLSGDAMVHIRANRHDGSSTEATITLEALNNAFGIITGTTKGDVDASMKDAKTIDVLSYNEGTGEKEYKNVQASAMTNPNARVMKITDVATGKSIRCTPEHKVWTKNRGYVEAQHLCVDDVLEIK